MDAGRKGVLQFLDVGDDQETGEFVLDGMDRLDQPFPPLGILRAEALVDDEGLQLCARATGQEAGEGDTEGEVDPELFPAGVVLVGPLAQFVHNTDVQRLPQFPGLGLPLGLQPDVHPAVGHPGEEPVGLGLDLRDGGLDDHRRDPLDAEGGAQFFVEPPLVGQFLLSFQVAGLLLLKGVAGGEPLLCSPQPAAGLRLGSADARQFFLDGGGLPQLLFQGLGLLPEFFQSGVGGLLLLRPPVDGFLQPGQGLPLLLHAGAGELQPALLLGERAVPLDGVAGRVVGLGVVSQFGRPSQDGLQFPPRLGGVGLRRERGLDPLQFGLGDLQRLRRLLASADPLGQRRRLPLQPRQHLELPLAGGDLRLQAGSFSGDLLQAGAVGAIGVPLLLPRRLQFFDQPLAVGFG